ncbi:MAG TPA: hypothetical protein VMW87_12265 [Spirochaetia bacterium]|nr:hypothetical protein [Spirochaetia bacterium]
MMPAPAWSAIMTLLKLGWQTDAFLTRVFVLVGSLTAAAGTFFGR